ncbi:MAG: hypothetical protein NZ484_01570 [Patescibacteria group bacterium]|nr:hypothetical protein [Patescibacteria group bacterium]MDW8279987.1 hypothetical protein [bacterium]
MFNFFKKNKNKLENKLKTHDIKIIPHKKVILFKKRGWKIEITSKDLFNFLYKFKFLFSSFAIFIIILLFVFYFKTKANVVQFYPESCLGGWQNPQNASGKPDLLKDSKEDNFNKNNSAVLNNVISEIYCGKFSGDIPENTEPIKAIIKFSWFIKEGGNNFIDLDNNLINIETSTLIQVIDSSTSGEINTLIEEDNSSTTEKQINSSTINNLNENNLNSNLPDQNSIKQNSNTEETKPQDAPKSEMLPNESIPSSFWNKLLKFVFAQDVNNTQIEFFNSSTEKDIINKTSQDNLENNNQNNFDLSNASSSDSSENLLNTSTKKFSNDDLLQTYSTSTINTENNQISTSSDDIFEILYTFDGLNWQSLGKVDFSNWQNLEFEIANFDWSKLDNFQVKIQSISPKEYNLIAYLDGMILETEYENINDLKEIKLEKQEIDLNLFDMNNLLKIHGIKDNLIVLLAKNNNQANVILGDLLLDKFYNLNKFNFNPSFDSPIGVKNNFIFWVNQKKDKIIAFDFENFNLYYKKLNSFDKSKGERAVLKFNNLDFDVIFDGSNFYFKDNISGEVFSDENSFGSENFRKKFNLDSILTKEQLSNLNFVIEEDKNNNE